VQDSTNESGCIMALEPIQYPMTTAETGLTATWQKQK